MSIKKYANYMSMNNSLEEAKEWIPKAEHEDIRCYVEADLYEQMAANANTWLKSCKVLQAENDELKRIVARYKRLNEGKDYDDE